MRAARVVAKIGVANVVIAAYRALGGRVGIPPPARPAAVAVITGAPDTAPVVGSYPTLIAFIQDPPCLVSSPLGIIGQSGVRINPSWAVAEKVPAWRWTITVPPKPIVPIPLQQVWPVWPARTRLTHFEQANSEIIPLSLARAPLPHRPPSHVSFLLPPAPPPQSLPPEPMLPSRQKERRKKEEKVRVKVTGTMYIGRMVTDMGCI